MITKCLLIPLLVFQDDKIIRDLVITVENYGFQFEEHLKKKPSALAIFTNYSNVVLHVKYIRQATRLSQEERLFQFSDSAFEISPDALPHESGAVIVVVWYKTLHSFLRNILYDWNSDAEVSSEIISASVLPKPKQTFSEPVRISWNTMTLVIYVTFYQLTIQYDAIYRKIKNCNGIGRK